MANAAGGKKNDHYTRSGRTEGALVRTSAAQTQTIPGEECFTNATGVMRLTMNKFISSLFARWIHLSQNSSFGFIDFSSPAGQGYMSAAPPVQQSSAAEPSVSPAPLPRISPLSSSPRLGQPPPRPRHRAPQLVRPQCCFPSTFPSAGGAGGGGGRGNERADVAFLPSPPLPSTSAPTALNAHSLSLLTHPLATCITALGNGKGKCKFISQNHSTPATKVMPLYREREGGGNGMRL